MTALKYGLFFHLLLVEQLQTYSNAFFLKSVGCSWSEIPNPKLEVKLTDFGIGQVVSQEALAGMTRMGFTQTMLGPGSSSHTGTQLYMAPELLAGQPASARSDIYSLGVVLYQLLIGDFARPLATDWAKRFSDPLLREDLEKCFAGDPQERFASAGELAQRIRGLDTRLIRLQAARRWKVARDAGIIATILLLVLTGAIWILRQPGPGLGGTKNMQALDRYTRGKAYLLNTRDQQALESAVGKFDEAISFDPNFARAYVDKAIACRQLGLVFDPGKGWDDQAFAAANRAIELCPRLAEAYVARGVLWFTHLRGWDAKRDVQDLQHALSLNPSVKGAYQQLSFVYGHLGLLDEALDAAAKELKFHPEDRTPQQIMGLWLLSKGKYKEALDDLSTVPDEAYPYARFKAWELGLAYFYFGEGEKATTLLEGMVGRHDLATDELVASVQAIFYAASNRVSAAEQKIEEAKKCDERLFQYHHITYNIGSAYALLGRNEDALRWLKASVDDGNPCYPFLDVDPTLRKLRADRAFQAFMGEERKRYEGIKRTFAGR